MLQSDARLYIIYILPQLKVLDFKKITKKVFYKNIFSQERDEAIRLFKDKESSDKTFTPVDPK